MNEVERLRDENERLKTIINGARAWSCGTSPYSDKELLRRVTELLNLTAKAKRQTAPANLSGDHLPEAQQDARPSVSHPYDY